MDIYILWDISNNIVICESEHWVYPQNAHLNDDTLILYFQTSPYESSMRISGILMDNIRLLLNISLNLLHMSCSSWLCFPHPFAQIRLAAQYAQLGLVEITGTSHRLLKHVETSAV